MTRLRTARFVAIRAPLADGVPSGPGPLPSHDRKGVAFRKTSVIRRQRLGSVTRAFLPVLRLSCAVEIAGAILGDRGECARCRNGDLQARRANPHPTLHVAVNFV